MATFTITSTADSTSDTGIGTVGTDGNASGTLREAINFANQNVATPAALTTVVVQKGLTGTITLASDLPLVATSLAFDGGGLTLSGNSAFRGFLISGIASNGVDAAPTTVSISDLTIEDVLAQGGNGGDGGGGGLGAGGAVFVGPAADVTLTNVVISQAEAVGGVGAFPSTNDYDFGGGGGLGGSGGFSDKVSGYGGGGGILFNGATDAGSGGGISSPGTGPTGGAGLNGLGGGGNIRNHGKFGGGGGGAFQGHTAATAGAGGFGGGGGGSNYGGGNGGFGGGGGGGGGEGPGGDGGFGGGGGEGALGLPGNGGFAAGGGPTIDANESGGSGGSGGGGSGYTGADGGNGASLGGAIFVASGGQLTISGPSTESGGSVALPASVTPPGYFATNGGGSSAAHGAAIFFQGTNGTPTTLTFGAGNQFFVDDITDYIGAGGTNPQVNGAGNPADTGGSVALSKTGTGTLTLFGANTYTGGTRISAGTLDLFANDVFTNGVLTSAAAGTGAITFAGAAASPAMLKLEVGAQPDAGGIYGDTLASFGAGDALDLVGLTYTSGTPATAEVFTPTGTGTGTLAVTENGRTERFTLSGVAAGTLYYAHTDQSGGTLINTGIACYCPGTLIRTDRGEMPVEILAIGDTVVTASGEHRPIKWLGRRSYAGRFLAANPNVQPIRFQAGSLGNGLPRRDLLVSPKHAMVLDGLLVPARALVNGSTIVRDRVGRVEYHHVELDSHDVLLAEGAPSESFMDDNSRGLFHNASEFAAMYPDAPAPAGFCAPRVESGHQLEAIRARLAATADQLARAA